MQIEGLVSEKISKPNGDETTIFYPEGRSKNRHIKVHVTANGGSTTELIEGRTSPGLELGEKVVLLKHDPEISDRLVRAMAQFHLGVDEAANGYTALDVEMISRGFEVRFASDGVPAWFRYEDGVTTFISKPKETGLPAGVDNQVQAIMLAMFNSRLAIEAPNLRSLLIYIDTKNHLRQLMPNAQKVFTISEDQFH